MNSTPLTNKFYNKLKFIAQILLPAVATAYFSTAQLWGLPNAEKVVGTITIVDTFLGLLLSASTAKYNKTEGAPLGDLHVSEDEDGKYLALNVDPTVLSNLDAKETVTLNVVNAPPPSPAE